MGYYKSCHSRERFSPHFGKFRGRREESDTLFVKIVHAQRNQRNQRDQREAQWLHVLCAGVERTHKTRSTTSDIIVSGPRMRQIKAK